MAAVNKERTTRIRVLVFLFFKFSSVAVRSWKIKVFGTAVVGRGYNEPELRRVIKTLLDAGVESRRERQENFWSVMNARVERRAPQNFVHLEQRLHKMWVEITIDDVAPF